MTNNGWWVFLCMMVAFVAPVRAEENKDQAAILAAFNSENSSEALALVRQAFAELKPDQSIQATSLLGSLLAVVPMELSGQVVAAAIEGNPALGKTILSAISDTGDTQRLAILNRLSFVASVEPQKLASVSESVPKLLSAADANIPIAERFTSPDYNPSNLLSETGVSISPHNPDLRKDLRDLRQDERQLEVDQFKLLLDRLEHKSAAAIQKEKQKIQNVKQDIKEDKKDIKQDEKGH